jgi:hypothetical protein
MSLEDRGAQHDKVVVDKYDDPSADYQMTTYDYVMRPIANDISGPFTITLPPVAEAKGRIYSIVARTADVTNTVTIEDCNNDSECWPGDITLNGKCDRALFYSDGLAWHVMSVLTYSDQNGVTTDIITPNTDAPPTTTS